MRRRLLLFYYTSYIKGIPFNCLTAETWNVHIYISCVSFCLFDFSMLNHRTWGCQTKAFPAFLYSHWAMLPSGSLRCCSCQTHSVYRQQNLSGWGQYPSGPFLSVSDIWRSIALALYIKMQIIWGKEGRKEEHQHWCSELSSDMKCLVSESGLDF